MSNFIVASNSCVLAINEDTGKEVWRVNLSKIYGAQVSLVNLSDSEVVAGCNGTIFKINKYNGSIIAKNKIKTLGTISLAKCNYL